ncbi:MAG: hypothetical protein AAFR04_00180 [Pseudomonadota bacterium]
MVDTSQGSTTRAASSWLSAATVLRALIILCIALFAADFVIAKKGKFAIEQVIGIYPACGFLSGVALLALVKPVIALLRRKETHYDG